MIGNSPTPRSQCLIVVATYPPVNLFTPVDPVGPGAGTPVSGSPFERDPLKGGE
ncbi:hypothetical protein PPS11_23034 [Pseudomonas putida S11]|nr:hypothetical protein PPS11_23034 [Pseudomonas putida S11]